MRSALIATFIVTAGILLLMGILLFGRTTASRSDTNEVAGEKRELQQGAVAELAGDFEYLENCAKYVMKDFQTRDIFEKNKDVMPQNALSMAIGAGRKLEKHLKQLDESDQLAGYTLVLEGNLNNEWEPRFDRNNTWAYQLSFSRALAVYKLWLKNGINIRQYPVEIIFSGGGYYGLCPQKDAASRRFSVQLIQRAEASAF